ncbi:MAG: gliding motility protein GldO [Bacteroidia bacterium]|nr:MAG: gliding motility protein GldO [Bacteroidia bacterium]
MKTISRFFLMLILCASSLTLMNAQQGVFKPGDYRDGIYEKENSVNRRFIPYTFLREADVAYKKRIWRDIDLRDKINLPLYYPINYESSETRISLFQLLKRYAISGQIITFSDEQFLIPLQLSDVKTKFSKCDSIEESTYDANGNEILTKTWQCDSLSILRNVLKYRVKEDWFFDKQRSVLDVRILGLQANLYVEEKETFKDLFWVYYPACRPFFAKHEVFNPRNPSENRTFEDIFWKRQFNSTIIKEENVYDRMLLEYLRGLDNLLEAERIKNDMFRWEHDLWHL